MESMNGSDDLRGWLEENGFRIAVNGMAYRDNLCNWYAYRQSELAARECEHNNKPMQLVVWPNEHSYYGIHCESVEVEVTGEVNGTWYKLMGYGPGHDELKSRLDEIEASLISAWNALKLPDQMREHIAQAVAMEREACAMACEKLPSLSEPYVSGIGGTSRNLTGRSECAAAIRARSGT